jgi:hypothetical protein
MKSFFMFSIAMVLVLIMSGCVSQQAEKKPYICEKCNDNNSCTDDYCYINGTCIYAERTPCCGNSRCESSESIRACPADCRAFCGNDICEYGENNINCCSDCGCQLDKKCIKNDCVNAVRFEFMDNGTRCRLDGKIKLNGIETGYTEGSSFVLDEKMYNKTAAGPFFLCLHGRLGPCFGNFSGWITSSNCWRFDSFPKDFSVINAITYIDPRHPTYINMSYERNESEYMNFVTPEALKNYLSEVNLTYNINNTGSDLMTINDYVKKKILYMETSITDWRTPAEAMTIGNGVCREIASTTLSLFLAYNSSLQCYNALIGSRNVSSEGYWHVITLCKVEPSPLNQFYMYGIYDYYLDNIVTTHIGAGYNYTTKRTKLANYLIKEYLNEYTSPKLSGREMLAVYNDREFITFSSNDEFIDWLAGL